MLILNPEIQRSQRSRDATTHTPASTHNKELSPQMSIVLRLRNPDLDSLLVTIIYYNSKGIRWYILFPSLSRAPKPWKDGMYLKLQPQWAGPKGLFLSLSLLTVLWSWRHGRIYAAQNAVGHFDSFLEDPAQLLSGSCNSQMDIYCFEGWG